MVQGGNFRVSGVAAALALAGIVFVPANFGASRCFCVVAHQIVVQGGDVRAVRQLDAAALAVGVAGIALLGAGGGLGVFHLGAAVVVVRICVTPLVDVSIRPLVVAGGAIHVVHGLGDAGGLGLQVHIARTEEMIRLVRFSLGAVEAAKPVLFGVPSYFGFREPFPTLREGVSTVVLLAAVGACTHSDTGRVAVAAAGRRVHRVTALSQAGAGVRPVVAAGLPLTPDVAKLAVFSSALLAGFARGAGGRFSAAGMVLGVIIRNPTPKLSAFRAFALCPVRLRVRHRTYRGRNVSKHFENCAFFASVAIVSACLRVRRYAHQADHDQRHQAPDQPLFHFLSLLKIESDFSFSSNCMASASNSRRITCSAIRRISRPATKRRVFSSSSAGT